jgi:hypothetical protein
MVNTELDSKFDEVACGYPLSDVANAAVGVLLLALTRMASSPEDLVDRLERLHQSLVKAVRETAKNMPFDDRSVH